MSDGDSNFVFLVEFRFKNNVIFWMVKKSKYSVWTLGLFWSLELDTLTLLLLLSIMESSDLIALHSTLVLRFTCGTNLKIQKINSRIQQDNGNDNYALLLFGTVRAPSSIITFVSTSLNVYTLSEME